jgi:FkbM family methyltransferase
VIARTLTRIRTRFHPLHRLRKHRWFRTIAARLDLPLSVRLRYVDFPVRIRLVRNATYWLTPQSPEPEILALFIAMQRVIEPDVFWDVGANIGIYGWLLKSLDHQVHVIMLEPDPVNCELLKQTRRRTSWLGDVDIRQVAASSHGGVVEFALDPISSATGSVLSDRRTFSEEQYGVIPATIQSASLALDDLGGPRPPKLIKIDTEGHESEVIAGATATLKTHSPVLVVECFDRDAQALVTLRALGYTLLDAERPDLASEQGCSSETTNFLAMPARLLEKLPTLLVVWRETLAQVRSASPSRRAGSRSGSRLPK